MKIYLVITIYRGLFHEVRAFTDETARNLRGSEMMAANIKEYQHGYDITFQDVEVEGS